MIDNYHMIKDQDQVNKVYYSQIIKNFESTSVALATANVWIIYILIFLSLYFSNNKKKLIFIIYTNIFLLSVLFMMAFLMFIFNLKKSFKLLKKETDQLKKENASLIEINNELDLNLGKKNKEISELAIKLNTTIQDYEIKLEKKEEEMWALSCQVTNCML